MVIKKMFLKDKPKWQGVTHRDQDTVIDPSGLCVAIGSLYPNHAFKILIWRRK